MTYKFSENREKYLGIGESACGIGTMLGPVIGSVLYSYLGYFGAFMMFAFILCIAGALSFFILPDQLNLKLDTAPAENREESTILI